MIGDEYMELPQGPFFDEFYYWFNRETKQEFYSTPLYYYKASYHMDTDNKVLEVYYKETEMTDNGLKHPAALLYPFQERLGLMLLRFLNADLSNFETANKTFFYAYGFEILKSFYKNYKFELLGNYKSNENYLKNVNTIFEILKYRLLDLQEDLKKAVTYIYNLDNDFILQKYTYSERFVVYLVKQKGDLHYYYKNDVVMRDDYIRKYLEFDKLREFEMLEALHQEKILLSKSDTHKSTDLSSICYSILEELSKTPNYPIKICQNCGKYFLPTSKTDEIYCDYPKENGKTCRELGAFQSYTERLKQNKAMGEYRKTYQQKFMQVRKDKENKELVKNFEKWKKEAKEKINQMKKGKLTEDEVYEWITKNK